MSKFFVSPTTGTVFKFRNGYLNYAEVELEIQLLSDKISFALTGAGWRGQGPVEDANDSYSEWKAGALAGIKFAFEVMQVGSIGVLVTHIWGRQFIDTNPWIVGEAAAKAIWQAADFNPPPELLARLEDLVATSWTLPEDQLPDFIPLL